VIALYAGTIIKAAKVLNEEDQALGYYGTDIIYLTSQHRGIASFMKHMPEEPIRHQIKDIWIIFISTINRQLGKKGIAHFILP
jgi:RNA binding exosome subunit